MAKKHVAALMAFALIGSASVAACSDGGGATCGPQAMGSHNVQLQSFSAPLPLKPGGGGSGGGSGGGGRGGSSSSGGSKSGGSKSGGSSSSGGGSYGGSKGPTVKSPSGKSYDDARVPRSTPDRGYRPAPGQYQGGQAPTYVQQPGGGWLPFIGGVVVGDMLSDPPAGCR